MADALDELHGHEFNDLWERWLTPEQRRKVRRAAWSSTPLQDPRLEALAAQHARRQGRLWVLQVVVWFGLVLGAVMRVTNSTSPATLDLVLLAAGSVGFVGAVVGVVTHGRSARRRTVVADWTAARQLARERRAARFSQAP